jgi:hypothetical protein
MKKIKLLLSVAMLSYTMVNAQATERTTLKELNIQSATFSAHQRVKGTDTLYYGSVYYQNAKYSSITDTEIIMFTKDGLNELITAFEYVLSKDDFSGSEYSCPISKSSLLGTTVGVALVSEDTKYTLFSRKHLTKNIEELKVLSELIK